MPIRQRFLLSVVVVAFVAFIASAATDSNWSKTDVAGLSVFAAFFVVLVWLTLLKRGSEPVEGHRGLPRGFWIVFASFAAAFALLMLLAVLSMPFVGLRGVEVLLGPEQWWVHVVVAAALFPFVRRRLL